MKRIDTPSANQPIEEESDGEDQDRGNDYRADSDCDEGENWKQGDHCEFDGLAGLAGLAGYGSLRDRVTSYMNDLNVPSDNFMV